MSLRSSVIDRASISTSTLPACRLAIMPFQSCATSRHSRRMRVHRFMDEFHLEAVPSTPSARVRFQGA